MEKGITRPNGSKKYIGILLMLTCALLWSANGLCIKLTPWNSMVLAGWRGFVSGANFSVRRVCWLRRGRCVPPEMLLMSFLQNGFQPLHSGCCGGLGV